MLVASVRTIIATLLNSARMSNFMEALYMLRRLILLSSSPVLNQTDDRFRDLDRAFPMREMANTFEQKPDIFPAKKPRTALRLFWVSALEAMCEQTSSFLPASSYCQPAAIAIVIVGTTPLRY